MNILEYINKLDNYIYTNINNIVSLNIKKLFEGFSNLINPVLTIIFFLIIYIIITERYISLIDLKEESISKRKEKRQKDLEKLKKVNKNENENEIKGESEDENENKNNFKENSRKENKLDIEQFLKLSAEISSNRIEKEKDKNINAKRLNKKLSVILEKTYIFAIGIIIGVLNYLINLSLGVHNINNLDIPKLTYSSVIISLNLIIIYEYIKYNREKIKDTSKEKNKNKSEEKIKNILIATFTTIFTIIVLISKAFVISNVFLDYVLGIILGVFVTIYLLKVFTN